MSSAFCRTYFFKNRTRNGEMASKKVLSASCLRQPATTTTTDARTLEAFLLAISPFLVRFLKNEVLLKAESLSYLIMCLKQCLITTN